MSFKIAHEFTGDYDTYKYDIKVPCGVSIMQGRSGKGKSLTLRIIRGILRNQNISSALVDYNDYDIGHEGIINVCKGKQVILLDNADLYLTEELLNKIIQVTPSSEVIVAMHFDTFINSIPHTYLAVEIEKGLLKTIPGKWSL